jgi:hypothetical protein
VWKTVLRPEDNPVIFCCELSLGPAGYGMSSRRVCFKGITMLGQPQRDVLVLTASWGP